MRSHLSVIALVSVAAALSSACTRKVPEQTFIRPSTKEPCWFTPPLQTGSRVVVDVPFEVYTHSSRMPTASDEAIVKALGGRVLHTFQVPMLRVEIDTAQLPRLLHRIGADMVLGVRDTTKKDILVTLYFNGPARPEDSVRVVAAGGRPSRLSNDRHLSAVVPDSVIPAIRKLPYVLWVRGPSGGCGGLPDPVSRVQQARPAPVRYDPKYPIRIVHEVATHHWPGGDYGPWVRQIVSTGREFLSHTSLDTSSSRVFRLALVRFPDHATLLIEEVRFGPAHCCGRIVAVREVELYSMLRGGWKDWYDDLRILETPEYGNLRIGVGSLVLELADIKQEPLRFVEMSR